MRISQVLNDNGSIEIHFEQLGYYEEFDIIAAALVKLGCMTVNKSEKVYIREWEFMCNGFTFTLKHDDALGN